jgi:hypothetical protein
MWGQNQNRSYRRQGLGGRAATVLESNDTITGGSGKLSGLTPPLHGITISSESYSNLNVELEKSPLEPTSGIPRVMQVKTLHLIPTTHQNAVLLDANHRPFITYGP